MKNLTNPISMNEILISLSIFLLLSCSSHDLKSRNQVIVPKVELAEGEVRANHESWSNNNMIATQGKTTSQIGQMIFEKGGNIIDVAVGVSFAISVERPQSTGIGGGGFLLYFDPATMDIPIAFDFRESAPLKSSMKDYLDKSGNVIERKSLDGIWAAGVPGLVAGLVKIHQKYGKLSLKEVMAGAIELASKGFSVYPQLAKALKYRWPVLKQYPASKKIFGKALGEGPLEEGDLLVQKDLAKTLTLISKKGRDGFYKGPVSAAVIKQQNKLKGPIRQNDFDEYIVKVRRPVEGKFMGHRVYSMSPPSSGGIHIIQILNMMEKKLLSEKGAFSADNIHLTATSMQLAFADRAKYLGDPDFVQIPVQGLISKSYAHELQSKIPKNRALNKKEFFPGNPFKYESSQTTHFTIMDISGKVVVSTQTINGWMGSGVVVPGTGILLNNEMDDFGLREGHLNLFKALAGKNNFIMPKKRPLSSMSPTIVLNKNGETLLGLGTPSGTRILTCVAQTILNYLKYGLNLYDSVSAVRYHHQGIPNEIRFDLPGPPQEVFERLESWGHKIRLKDLGCKVQAIAMEDGRLHGVSDPRGQGSAIGN